jgi:hypothetical protein
MWVISEKGDRNKEAFAVTAARAGRLDPCSEFGDSPQALFKITPESMRHGFEQSQFKMLLFLGDHQLGAHTSQDGTLKMGLAQSNHFANENTARSTPHLDFVVTESKQALVIFCT